MFYHGDEVIILDIPEGAQIAGFELGMKAVVDFQDSYDLVWVVHPNNTNIFWFFPHELSKL